MLRPGIVTLSLLLLSSSANAAPMVRVIAVDDSRTVVVDRNGTPERLQLAGVAVPPDQEEPATLWLRQTLLKAWVLAEGPPTATTLYRSPDVMLINAELSQQRWLHANVHMTYLGEVDPGGLATHRSPRPAAAAKVKAPKPPRAPRPVKAPKAPKPPTPPRPPKATKMTVARGVIR